MWLLAGVVDMCGAGQICSSSFDSPKPSSVESHFKNSYYPGACIYIVKPYTSLGKIE